MNMKYIITEAQYKLIMEASSPAQQAAIAINMKKKGIKPKNETLYEDEYGSVEETNFVVGDLLNEAEYQTQHVVKVLERDIIVKILDRSTKVATGVVSSGSKNYITQFLYDLN